ncbi:MAG: HEAT repeat domain-containing protein [Dehalococcoidia bacterium]
MALEQRAKRPPPQLTEEELAEGFTRLAAGQWRVKEAQPFTRKVRAVPSVAAPFLIERLAQGRQRDQEVATALLGQLQGPRVIAPLRTLLQDRSANDGARAAAATILATLGEPVHIEALAGSLKDPDALLHNIWETVLLKAQAEEPFRQQFLACLEEDDPEARDEVLQALATPQDPRALALFLPLLHSRRVRTVLAAIDAIEAVGSLEGAPGLEERAESDPNPRVRNCARAAYGRMLMRTNPLWAEHGPAVLSGAHPPQALPVHHSWVTLIDQHGDQAVLVSRRRPDGFLKVVTVLTSDTEGVKDCFGVDMMKEEELAEIGQQLAHQGLTPVDVEPAHCQNVVDEARRFSIEHRRRLPMELEIWKGLLDPPPVDQPRQLPLWEQGTEDLLNFLPKTGALLTTPEFRQWFFAPELVWPYLDEWCTVSLDQQQGDQGRATLNALVTLAANDLIDREHRQLLSQRLARQSVLLCHLGKPDPARLAAAAALGLDPDEGIPVDLHPFARAMVLSSFFNAGLRPPQAGLSETP